MDNDIMQNVDEYNMVSSPFGLLYFVLISFRWYKDLRSLSTSVLIGILLLLIIAWGILLYHFKAC